MDNTKIGTFIKQLRKEKNLTQKELADKLGITDRAISKWERGLGCPDISLLEDLSNVLDITVLELLKGEKLPPKQTLEEKDLLDSMNFSRKNTIKIIKKANNYITILIITTLLIFIIITNIKSINFARKQFDWNNYLKQDKESQYEQPTNQLIKEVNDKIELILTNKGIYKNEDYIPIRTHINLLKETLIEQQNNKFMEKNIYTYHDLLNFYLSHQNITTHPLDNKDLYPIILKYNSTLSDNLIQYNYYETSIHEIYFDIYSYLDEPYYITSKLPYKDYEPNPYILIKKIYQKELILLNDIIKAGDIK